MPRSRRLTAEEAAECLGLSVSRITEMARNHEIGRKDGGRWTFSEAEIRRVAQERTDRANAFKLRKRLEVNLDEWFYDMPEICDGAV